MKEEILRLCLEETSKDPIQILRKLMAQPFCRMHGPEHHILVGSALLTAYKNAGGDIELKPCLEELASRAQNVPGAACGYWGACGAAISTGMFLSVATGSGPLKVEQWRYPNKMTSLALDWISSVGGPRCCKRDSYFALQAAVIYVKEQFGICMDFSEITCTHSHLNQQCLKTQCPFYPKQGASKSGFSLE